MEKATERQREILECVKELTALKGYPPTYKEIGDCKGITPSAAMDHVKALGRKGYLTYREKISRSIVIIREGVC